MNILCTGFAGTLGSAFTRYLLEQGHTIIGVDNNEWAVAAFPDHERLTKFLGDFGDTTRMNGFDAVIHCAAYKHVDLGESNTVRFCDNNIAKSSKLFDMAQGSDAKILLISTDKAVEPISTYGFTKALCERLCWHWGGQVARLGNILSSNGSVIPLWEKQIADKEPITITDPAMTRYVIEADEAVKQIWDGFLRGDTLIIPEMGEPKPLLSILDEVLLAHGEPLDHPTKIIGLRPGEKMHEKLKWDWE